MSTLTDRRHASMSRSTFMGRCALGAVSAALLATLSGCVILDEAKFSRTIDVTVPHVTGSAIDVETANGSITVVAGQAQDVIVTAKLRAVTQERADAATVTTNRDASGKLVVRVVWPEKRHNNEACSFEITVPDASGVKLDSSNGRIEVAGLSGKADLDTSNGEISVTNHAGPVDAETSNGAIVMKNVGAPVEAETSNGAIRVEFSPTAVGWFELDSSNGDIDVLLSPLFVGQFDADTSNGKFTLSNLTPTSTRKSSKGHAELTFGQPAAGEKKSTADTSNGSITVRGGTK
jgi:DUF4097 and DUF4098 domain-containing protein YvlB